MLKAVGLLFIALGHLVGAALVAEPLGVLHVRTGAAPSLLFLILIAAGYLMVAVASRLGTVHILTRFLGSTLLLLAGGAAIVLVMLVVGTTARPGSMAQVAFVFVVSALFGAFSLLGLRPAETT